MAEKEVTVRQVGNGGFVVLEQQKSQSYGAGSNQNVVAAFTRYEDLVTGLGDIFGFKGDGLNVDYLKTKMQSGYQGPG